MSIFRIKFFIVSIFLSFSLFSQVTSETIVLNEEGNGKDASIGNAGVKEVNFGTYDYLNVYHDDEMTPIVYRSLLQFDLSHIPTNAIVVNAELVLTPKIVITEANFDYNVRRVDGQWSKDEVTGANQNEGVITDEIRFISPSSISMLQHEITVKDHVQNMVNYPYNNHGWKISLDDESLEGDYGVSFYSSNYEEVSKRPKLVVNYVLPVEVETNVLHCTAGNDDGSVNFIITGGSESYSQYVIYKVEENFEITTKVTQKSISIVAGDVVSGDVISVANLAPGLYVIRVKDALSGANYKYQKFLIGREGEVTEVLITIYVDQTKIGINLGSTQDVSDFANTAYGPNISSLSIGTTGTNSYGSSNAYHFSSLLNLNIDVAPDLDIISANLYMGSFYRYQHTTSSNELIISAITNSWDQYNVTWNSRPPIDINENIILEKSSNPNGFSAGYDTIDIKPFMEYWQTNPNYGIEMSLTNYESYRSAFRSQKRMRLGSHLRLSFKVKSMLTATFDETTNKGSIIVDAPDGELPYTYLIGYTTLPEMNLMWNTLKDSIPLTDSLSFFRGKVNSKSFTFSGFNSGEYFIGVFDNDGQEIFQESVVLSPDIILSSSNNISLDDGFYSKNIVSEEDGRITLMYLFPKDESSGIVFELKDIDGGIFGFSYDETASLNNSSDFVFGIEILNSIEYKIIYFGKTQSEIYSIQENDRFKMGKDNNDFVLYKNSIEVYRGDIGLDLEHDLKMDMIFKGDTKGYPVYPIGKWTKPKPIVNINYPECGESVGSLRILYPVCSQTLGCVTNIQPTLYYSNGNEVIGMAGGVYPNLDIGIYTLELIWDLTINGFSMPSQTSTKEIAIGYVIDWNNSSNSTVLPNTLNTLTTTVTNDYAVAYSNFQTEIGNQASDDDWIQFESKITQGIDYCFSLKKTNSMQMFDLVLKSGGVSGDRRIGIYTGNLWPQVAITIEPISYMPIFSPGNYAYSGLSANSEFRIHQNSSGIQVYHVNNSTPIFTDNSTVSIDQSPLFPRVFQSGKPKCIRTISSFCYPNEIPVQFCQLKRKLEGGYYKVPYDNLLLVEYNDEYLNLEQKLNYVIKDYTGVVVMSTDTNVHSVKFGDNRITIDIGDLTYNSFYILEVSNDKNETFYLRFKKQ